MAARNIKNRLYVNWGHGASILEDTLISAQGEMRLIPFGGSIFATQGIISTCTLTLHNTLEVDGGRRYSSLDTRSDLFSSLQDGGAYHVPMYLEISINDGVSYDRIFTGVMKIPSEAGAAVSGVGQINVDCRSREEELLQLRQSTTQSQFATNYDTPVTESDLISQWLTQAGISGGEMSLDDGLFTIPWAWLENESVIESCWLLAAACGGRFYARPDGMFAYENAHHWMFSPHVAVPATTMGKDDYARVRPRWVDNELYNKIRVPYFTHEIEESQVLWESRETYTIFGLDSIDIVATYSSPAYAIDATTVQVMKSTGEDATSDVTVTTVSYAQHMEINIENDISDELYVTLVRVEGQPVVSTSRDPVELGHTTAYNSFWTNLAGRTRTFPQNKFIQSRRHALWLCELLRDWHQQSRNFFVIEGIPGVATTRLGQRLRLNDDDISSDNQDAFITSIGWSYSRNGFRMNWEGVNSDLFYPAYAAPGAANMDYFEIGTDLMGNTGGTTNQMFY